MNFHRDVIRAGVRSDPIGEHVTVSQRCVVPGARCGQHGVPAHGGRRRQAAAVGSVLLSALLGACTHVAGTPAARAANTLLPSASQLSTTHFHDTTAACHLLRRQPTDTVEHDEGEVRTEVRTTSYGGAPALLIVQTRTVGHSFFLDSALVRREEMTPVWEISHFRARRTRYDYDGSRVRVEITAPDSARRHEEHRYDVPVFAFAELDALVSTVPRRTGYQAILPLYSEGSDALEMDTVRVERRDDAGVWNIRFADPVIISHYRIDESTGARVGYSIERHDGSATFRCVPSSSRSS